VSTLISNNLSHIKGVKKEKKMNEKIQNMVREFNDKTRRYKTRIWDDSNNRPYLFGEHLKGAGKPAIEAINAGFSKATVDEAVCLTGLVVDLAYRSNEDSSDIGAFVTESVFGGEKIIPQTSRPCSTDRQLLSVTPTARFSPESQLRVWYGIPSWICDDNVESSGRENLLLEIVTSHIEIDRYKQELVNRYSDGSHLELKCAQYDHSYGSTEIWLPHFKKFF
jgi:hypothetical protein